MISIRNYDRFKWGRKKNKSKKDDQLVSANVSPSPIPEFSEVCQ